MKKVNLLSIPVSTGPYDEYVNHIIDSAITKKKEYTCLANVHMLIEAYKNKDFANVVRNAKIVTPDGKPLTWALLMLYGIRQDRVAGVDLLTDLLSVADDKNLSVYFYGGTKDIIDKTKRYLSVNFPNLKLAGTCSPPFRCLTKEEEEETILEINQSGADLVFVALGCPKQEKWMFSMQGKINAVSVGIGAALPVMVGLYKRAPKWVRDAGFEWLYRLMQEPKRLFKRYAVTNSFFLYLLIKEFLSKKLHAKVA